MEHTCASSKEMLAKKHQPAPLSQETASRSLFFCHLCPMGLKI